MNPDVMAGALVSAALPDLVLATGWLLGTDERLEDVETGHGHPGQHCRTRVGLSFAEQ